MPSDSHNTELVDLSADELIQRIASLIVNDVDYRESDWQSLALVGDFSHGQTAMTGYLYFDDRPFSAQLPDAGWDILEALVALRDTMAACTRENDVWHGNNRNGSGLPWHQCLIHITKPEMKIAIQFEYDDPDRWSPGGKSLDMSAYAKLLQPAMPD